jgi:strictosidine synthase-like protein
MTNDNAIRRMTGGQALAEMLKLARIGPGLRMIDTGDEFGPEHIAISPDDELYAAMTRSAVDVARRLTFRNAHHHGS